MTFRPFLPPWLLLVAALAVVLARCFTLWRTRGATGKPRLRQLGRWASITAALLMVVLAAAGPVARGEDITQTAVDHTKKISPTGADLNIYLVVDRSVSTMARDQGPGEGTARASRISAIRADAAALVEKFPEARFNVVGWGTSAQVEWPLSPDRYTLAATLRGLPPYSIGPIRNGPETPVLSTYLDVDRGAAAPLLGSMLDSQRTTYPERANVVVYFGCGESDGVQRPQTSFGDVAGLFDGGVVLGYGTPEGGQLLTSSSDGQHPVGTRSGGSPLVLKYDEKTMRQVADQLVVPYVHRQLGQSTAPITAAITGPAQPRPAAQLTATGFPLYWALLLFAAAVGLVESYRAVRDRRRMALIAKAVREGTA
jgi:Ca-activated chloride channel family protein